jgi:hypothetical protein
MFPKPIKWLDISVWLKLFANLHSFMLLKHSIMIPFFIDDMLYLYDVPVGGYFKLEGTK